MLKPIYKPVEFAGLAGVTIFGKTKQLDELLQDFLAGNRMEIAPSLFAYAGHFFWVRYHGYSVVSVPEMGEDVRFNVGEKIFSPFGFSISKVVEEKIVESGDEVRTKYCLRPGIAVPKKVILFSCRPNPAALKAFVALLKKGGVSTVKGVFLTD